MKNVFKMVGKLALASGALLALPAFAGGVSTDTTFKDFSDQVQAWATGSLGTGLAVSTLLIGAGIGVAKNSPMPALSGIASAAFIHWGPAVITSIMNSGAVI